MHKIIHVKDFSFHISYERNKQCSHLIFTFSAGIRLSVFTCGTGTFGEIFLIIFALCQELCLHFPLS